MNNSIPAPTKSLDYVLAHIRAGGVAYVATYARYIPIDAKCLAKWEAAGIPLLREDGDGYRMRQGKGSVYLLPGQLKLSA